MRGLYLDRGALSFREDLDEPQLGPGEVLVEVLQAGVCATDLALQRGYMDFTGIPGHEFVGRALSGPLAGKRVVGDINAACGACATCVSGDPHHCPHRTVLGILGRGGAFAERLALPQCNLLPVPDSVSTDAATFVEPLAAALEIGEQVALRAGERALVAGDGRLGILCAWALHLDGVVVTVAGRHAERRDLLPAGVELVVGVPDCVARPFDLAVEATGDPSVLGQILPLVRPRGRVVLKTTAEVEATLDLSRVVVDELVLVGSRCGPTAKAVEVLAAGAVPVERLIAARFGLASGVDAFAAARGALKVLVSVP
ncbi:MAG: alcohol dehydrogenase catalytic domain-containing protein [Planctomycetes bacterium]|nr:alcohol dehydrogenase catalytic domain-containing protein [Planctomycetota bacterium]MCB9871808.1 alcohol dehydrogenase catalytic domain-containing protein [Planctomycetota bacterium]MCB9889686.1 alcohol dehydrogenase catalytic domain-containing protein [Planctomycetota bacterium]